MKNPARWGLSGVLTGGSKLALHGLRGFEPSVGGQFATALIELVCARLPNLVNGRIQFGAFAIAHAMSRYLLHGRRRDIGAERIAQTRTSALA